MKSKLPILFAALAFVGGGGMLLTAAPSGTAFTYQGCLNDGANPATGIYDLKFEIFDALAGPTQIGPAFTNAATGVTNGLFTIPLDFGTGVFNGNARWLDIAVRTNGAASFTSLSPRQPLTPAPYAQYAPSAGTAATAASVAAGNISGVVALTNLPTAVLTNGASGASLSGTFSGNGKGLTNLNAAPVINVKNYGAVGNGVVDDTVAIQAALNAANAITAPGTVFFPRGVYVISDALVVPESVNILGSGSDNYNNPNWAKASAIVQTNAGKNALRLNSVGNQWIRDISLRGPAASVYTTCGMSISNGVGAPNGEQFSAHNVSIRGFGYGVETFGPSSISFDGCYIYNNFAGQFLLEGYVDSTIIRSCNLGYNTNGVGWSYAPTIVTTSDSNVKSIIVENCEIGNAGPALSTKGGFSVIFRGCNFERTDARTNLFAINNSLELLVENCRIAEGINTNAIVRGIGSGTRTVNFVNTSPIWGNHTAPVEGATGVPLLFEDESDNLAGFFSNTRSGVWRTKSGSAWAYRAASQTASVRRGYSFTPSIATRGRLLGSFTADNSHATSADSWFFDGYFNSTNIGRRTLAVTSNETFYGTTVMNGNVGIAVGVPSVALDVAGTVKASASIVSPGVGYFTGGVWTASAITNSGLVWFTAATNDVPALVDAPNGSFCTTTSGQFYVRSNGTWILH